MKLMARRDYPEVTSWPTRNGLRRANSSLQTKSYIGSQIGDPLFRPRTSLLGSGEIA